MENKENPCRYVLQGFFLQLFSFVYNTIRKNKSCFKFIFLEKERSMVLDFKSSLVKDAERRLWFLSIIEKGESANITPDICKADKCDFGQWLTSPIGERYKLLRSHQDCSKAHETFHEEVTKIARLINTGQREKAQEQLGEGMGYAVAFKAFLDAVRKLDQETIKQ